MNLQAPSVGPIMGHTTSSSIRVWARGEVPGPGSVGFLAVLSEEAGGSASVSVARLDREQDHCAVLDVTGLPAATEIVIRVAVLYLDAGSPPPAPKLSDFAAIPVHRVRTARTPGKGPLRLLVGSCREIKPDRPELLAPGDRTFEPMLRTVRESGADALLMVGDQIYGDRVEPWENSYLGGYQALYREAFTQAHLRALLAAVPTYMTLDDHEIKNNWSGRPSKGNRGRRYRGAIAAYETYQQLHGPSPTPGTYHYSFDLGPASIFVLDVRTEREKHKMIGGPQEQALTEWLRKENASVAVRFVVTAVPFLERTNKDKWSKRSYRDQRARILGECLRSPTSNIVFLSGDLHTSSFTTLETRRPAKTISSVIASAFYRKKARISSKPKFRPVRDEEDVKYYLTPRIPARKEDGFAEVSWDDGELRVAFHSQDGSVWGEASAPQV